MPHNHPPRCCCENTIGKQPDGTRITDPDQICTSCVIHGELAQLADNECPSCHQLPGRGPTDYCRQPRWHTTRGIVNEPQTYIDGPKTLTTQPATRTTTPPTQIRGELGPELFIPADGTHVDLVGALRDSIDRAREQRPTPLATPTPPHQDETWHFPPSTTEWPANPRPHPAKQCTSHCNPPPPAATPTPPTPE